MNDDDLRQKLAALSVAPPDETARARARQRVLLAFGTPANRRQQRRAALGWTAGALATAVVLAVALFSWPQPATRSRPDDAALLGQMETLFPGQLNAIIERGANVQVDLAAAPGAASNQPLWIEFRRGTDRIRVLGFSGRQVCVDFAGRRVCFEPLLDEHGAVILTGDDFIWTPDHRAEMTGWKIAAATLDHAS
jgi:hypothetical protein